MQPRNATEVDHPTLTTARLRLRPFRPDDAADVQRLAGDRRIAATTLNVPHPYEDGMAEQWLATLEPQFRAGTLVNFAVCLSDTLELIGSIGLKVNSAASRAELGYWIGVPYWNRGYATEAVHAVIEFGFDVLNLNRICAQYLGSNPASGRVMEKAGMRREGLLPQHEKKWERYEDIVLYGALREEWGGDGS